MEYGQCQLRTCAVKVHDRASSIIVVVCSMKKTQRQEWVDYKIFVVRYN
jgi:hypothetical protein